MSCAHGICGSDGLTINGLPALACQKLVKDLVVDLEPLFNRNRAIDPETTQTESSSTENVAERLQDPADRNLFDDALKCILCACCVAACPVNLKEDTEFVGPAALLKGQRYIFDSRTQNPDERMHVLDKAHGIWSCKSYYQCTRVCPKGIRVTEAILRTKKKILQEARSKQKQEG